MNGAKTWSEIALLRTAPAGRGVQPYFSTVVEPFRVTVSQIQRAWPGRASPCEKQDPSGGPRRRRRNLKGRQRCGQGRPIRIDSSSEGAGCLRELPRAAHQLPGCLRSTDPRYAGRYALPHSTCRSAPRRLLQSQLELQPKRTRVVWVRVNTLRCTPVSIRASVSDA